MNRLAEPVPVQTGLLVFIGAALATAITASPWAALATLAVAVCWWRAHCRREAHIAEVRARMACDPLRVSQMEWPW